MDDKRGPPIEEQGFLSGVKVVDIGDYRIARGLTRRAYSGCHHRNMVYDQKERRIWCKDCEHDIEPFDAFASIIASYSQAYDTLLTRQNAVAEAEQFQARTIAGKKLDEAWRRRKMVPACPHCSMGLFPEDFKKGFPMLGRDYAAMLLKKRRGENGGSGG
jgi:hypothetical protein